MTRCRAVVPQISIISGVSAGGGAYSPALGDVVIMTRDASMFLTGPGVVREVMGEDVDAITLGGAKVQAANGVCHMVAEDDARPRGWRATCSACCRRRRASRCRSPRRWPPLPRRSGRRRPRRPAQGLRRARRPRAARRRRLAARVRRALGAQHRPARGRGSRAARSASSPTSRATSAASSTPRRRRRPRASSRTCHLFGVPLVAVVDTPGFMPGTKQEAAGVIRHGAKLVHAFAEARGAEADRDAAQELRRRAHRDELQGARRRPLPRLAERDARRDGRRAGRRHRPPAPLAAAEDSPPSARASPRRTPTSTSARRTPPREGFVDEVIEPSRDARPARRPRWRCSTATPAADARAGNVPPCDPALRGSPR